MDAAVSKVMDSTAGLTIVGALSLLGGWQVLKAVFGLVNGIYKYFIRGGINLKKLGSWAVVTGATDGIGKAYAQALAKKGFNLLIISRTESKLKADAEELHAKYKVQVSTLAADFGTATDATWGNIAAAVEGLDVGVLINNVGVSYDHAEYFDAVDEKLANDLMQINVVATTKMTRIVLPGMKARRKGAIVNIGSAASTVWKAWPLYAGYAASKAYVDNLSRSLDLELKQFGISVQNQAPLYVATKLAKIRKPRLDAPTPSAYVASALRHIGYEPTTCAYWYHALMAGIIGLMPDWYANRFILDYDINMRKRYYAKLAREAKAK